MNFNIFGLMQKNNKDINNIQAPTYHVGALNDIYKNPIYHTIKSNILLKQNNLIFQYHDMTFVAAHSDYSFVLPAPYKSYTGQKNAEEREERYQEDKLFTNIIFKKNITTSKKLDAKEKSRSELFAEIRKIYPSFGLNIKEKISNEDYELLNSVRKAFRHVFTLDNQGYNSEISQKERLLALQDKLSEVIDSESFSKACNIEDKFMINEINEFFKLYNRSSLEQQRAMKCSSLHTHDGIKISPIDLLRKIKTDRIDRTHKYEQISSLYTKLGTSNKIKIKLKPDHDIEK